MAVFFTERFDVGVASGRLRIPSLHRRPAGDRLCG